MKGDFLDAEKTANENLEKTTQMIKTLFAGVLATLVMGSTALAADLGDEIIPVAPVADVSDAFDWTGAYVGVTGGFAWGEASGSAGGFEQSFDTDGMLGGVMIGVNRQFGNIVVGGEIDASFANIEGTTNVFGTDVESSVDGLATARVRVGYAFDRFLPYLTGGVAAVNNTISVPGTGIEDSSLHIGYVVGAGVEYAITGSLTVRGEYNYIDAGTADYALGLVEGDLDMHLVKAGIAYKF